MIRPEPGLATGGRRAHEQDRERRRLVAALHELAPEVRRRGLRVVIGVPGDDVHVAAIRMAERLLEAVGYEVVNLGVMVGVAEIVEACRRFAPAAVVLSSSNGHALANCGEVPALLAAAGIEAPVYLGGRLVVGRQDWLDVRGRFEGLGFRGVFAPWVSLPEGVLDVSRDLLALPEAGRIELGATV
jgi:methylaspartate mutase sigma subunit